MKYKKNYILLVLCITIKLSNSQSVSRTMRKLPDTGQNTSYTNTFGEDNDYYIDMPLLLSNPDGTVTDSITELMWQKGDGGEMTFERAIIYCDTLTIGGFTNWRLPNAHEAFSILNHQNANPAIDTKIFASTGAEYWWTSDKQANDSTKIWVTNSGGGIGNHLKTETISAGGSKKFHVRAVRDINTPAMIANHFTDNNDGTITDNLTNLIWQKIPFKDSLNWEQALTYADSLSLGGTNDWRLPNIKELQSINDEKSINPSLNTNYFTVSGTSKYWSSTTLPNQVSKAWYLNTQFGITTYDLKTIKHNIICVKNRTLNTGFEKINHSKILIYPNPFKSTINVNNQPDNTIFELIDAFGKTIYSGIDIGKQDFSLLPAAVYYLKAINESISIIKISKY